MAREAEQHRYRRLPGEREPCILMNDDRQVSIGGHIGARAVAVPAGRDPPQRTARGGAAAQAGGHQPARRPGGRSPARRTEYATRLPQFVPSRASPLCIGQKQRWYLLKLGASESALRFDATEQGPEFDRWRWVSWWDAVHDVIYFKRFVYSRALHELGAHAFPEGLPPYPAWWHEQMARAHAMPRADSEWTRDTERHDADEQERGDLVEPAVPARAVGALSRSKNPPPVVRTRRDNRPARAFGARPSVSSSAGFLASGQTPNTAVRIAPIVMIANRRASSPGGATPAASLAEHGHTNGRGR